MEWLTMSRVFLFLAWTTCIFLLHYAAKASAAEPVLPQGDAPPPVANAHFPDRLHAFVWRNWNAVEPAKLAAIVCASVDDITTIATSMALPAEPVVSPDLKTRGYATLIRRNW